MSVLDKDKIDGIGICDNLSQLALLITDHIDWTNEFDHLVHLQHKINSYISFIESKQYNEIYPKQKFISFCIEIHFQHVPTQNCFKFINTINEQLHKNQIYVQIKTEK